MRRKKAALSVALASVMATSPCQSLMGLDMGGKVEAQTKEENAVRSRPIVVLMEFPDYKFSDIEKNEIYGWKKDEKGNWQIDTSENAEFREKQRKYRKLPGEKFTAEHVNEWLFTDGFYKTSKEEGGRQTMSIREFYNQMTAGAYKFEGEVFGPYTAEHNIAWYGTDRAADDPNNVRVGSSQDEVGMLVAEAAKQLIDNPQRDGKKVAFNADHFDVEKRSKFITDKNHPDGYYKPSDGKFGEKDGVVDTIIVVAAGVGHEWGGGRLGEKAIHPFRMGFSWFWNWNRLEGDDAAFSNCIIKGKDGKEYRFEDFIAVSQDAALDILDHEHGHLLGLPDLYDTTGSNSNPPVNYWDIMGSGYTGSHVIGSAPVAYGAYSREWLQEEFLKREVKKPQWLSNKQTFNIKDIEKEGVDLYLNQAHDRKFNIDNNLSDMVRIDMPKMKHRKFRDIPAHDGRPVFFSGNVNNNRTAMKMRVDLKDFSDAKLNFNTFYNIDPNFDFATVRVNEVNSSDWESLSGNITTDKLDDWLMKDENCSLEERLERLPGHGITGKSNAWTEAEFDLSKYDGKEIEISFCFWTDGNTPEDGIFIDDIEVTGIKNSVDEDTVKDKNRSLVKKITGENPDEMDLVSGFLLDERANKEYNKDAQEEGVSGGYKEGFKIVNPEKDNTLDEHYYLLEWRNAVEGKVDEGLKQVREYWPNISYDPGLVIWHIDKRWQDNQGKPDQGTKNHPGECLVGVVDADQTPVGYWKNVSEDPKKEEWVYKRDKHNQFDMHDAAFSLSKGAWLTHKWNDKVVSEERLGEQNAYPVFSDNRNYENNSIGRGWKDDDFETGRQWGLRLEDQGLRILVTKEKADHSGAYIHIMDRNKGGNKVDYRQGVNVSYVVKNKEGKILVDAYNAEKKENLGKNAYLHMTDGSVYDLENNKGVFEYIPSADKKSLQNEDKEAKVDFVIIEDKEGNLNAVYNSQTNYGYGKEIILADTEEKAQAQVLINDKKQIKEDIEKMEYLTLEEVSDFKKEAEKAETSKDLQELLLKAYAANVNTSLKEKSVRGRNNKRYSDTTIQVKRLAGADRIKTSVEVSKKYFSKANNAVLVSSKNYSDALVSAAFAKMKNAPILLTQKDSLDKSIIEEMKRLGVKELTIVGGENSVSEKLEEEIKKKGISVERVAGKDRYETSEKLANKVLGKNKSNKLALVNGAKNADALSISSMSTKEDMPVVLIKNDLAKDGLTDKLLKLNVKEVLAVGGKTSISEEVLNSIPVEKKSRIAGEDRYETALKIAKISYPNAESVFISNGEKLIDALAAGSVTYKEKAPIILTKKNSAKSSIKEFLKSVKNRIIVGGEESIGKDHLTK